MESIIEISSATACRIYGGKSKEVAQLVEFIAECIGSLLKAIHIANKFRKMFTAPNTI